MSWTLGLISALCIGLSKGGLKGLGTIVVLLMLIAYGAKPSVGIVLPLLILGDILAIMYYKKSIDFKYIKEFLPWIIGGVILGALLGKNVDTKVFEKIIALIILFSLISMLIWDYLLKNQIKPGVAVTGILGICAGVFSMLGNFAGAFSNIYFLLTKLPKKELIGTSTLVFLIVNAVKLPFHIFHWETISSASLLIDLKLIPAVIVGFIIGVKTVHLISEKGFRKFLYVITILGALIILFK